MIDGAGIGSCMAANKVPGVRAALAYDLSSARNSREHNDANVLTLGAGLIGAGLARQIVDLWLATECTEPRHQKRVAMFGEPATDFDLSEQDIDRVVGRLHQIIGPMQGAANATHSMGDDPEIAREFLRLGATGLFANPAVNEAGTGLFYGNPKQLWIQIISIVATAVFTAIGTLIVIFITKLLTGGLRVTEETEVAGLDSSIHGERGFEIQ